MVIAVTDNGAGVPRAEQEAIFEKFRRGSAAARSGAQGSGLGLAIVRAIVKAHRGRVDVRSSDERGPLPHHPAPPAPGGGMTASSAGGGTGAGASDLPPATRPFVIVVEDDPAIAEGLALNLKLLGYRAEVIADGETARARIGEGRPDLVLLDISLPKQSGIWVLERLREAQDHVPVIVLSARQDEFEKVAALRLGADDYVTKPFALAELLARVDAVLRRARLSGRAAAPAETGAEQRAVARRRGRTRCCASAI